MTYHRPPEVSHTAWQSVLRTALLEHNQLLQTYAQPRVNKRHQLPYAYHTDISCNIIKNLEAEELL